VYGGGVLGDNRKMGPPSLSTRSSFDKKKVKARINPSLILKTGTVEYLPIQYSSQTRLQLSEPSRICSLPQ